MTTDLHVHSSCSCDCRCTMDEMAEAAVAAGIDILCFTDHCDIARFDMAGVPDPDCFQTWSQALTRYPEVRERFGGQIELLLGMELGELNQDPIFSQKISETPGLDFIIGSIHALRDTTDFFCIDYQSQEQCTDLAGRYLEENIEAARQGHFDVLGHIGYTNRYMKRAGFVVDFSPFEDRIRTLFTVVAQSGKGIELNTSGLRQGVGSTFPEPYMLRLYRECGGEIITVGSDAHKTWDVGAHIPEAMELLRETGFRYFSVFRDRKPHFIKL